MEFDYYERLERLVLAFQGLPLPIFSRLLQERGFMQQKRLPKTWRNGTGHDSVQFHVCLLFLTDLLCQATFCRGIHELPQNDDKKGIFSLIIRWIHLYIESVSHAPQCAKKQQQQKEI